MTDLTVAFIGLGLIGGSVAKGLKRRAPGTRIMAYMRTREKLKQAKRDGIVDVILDGVDEHLSECDIIFLCTDVYKRQAPCMGPAGDSIFQSSH